MSDTVPFYIYRNIVRHTHKMTCPRCWLLYRGCMCDLIKPMQLPKHIHFHYIVHHTEYLRASNTVKLFIRGVQQAHMEANQADLKFNQVDTLKLYTDEHEDVSDGSYFNGNHANLQTNTELGTAEMLFHGITAHEKKIHELVSLAGRDDADVIVLFPSSNPPAVDVEEFVKTREARIQQDEEKSSTSIDTTTGNTKTVRPLHVLVMDGTWKQANHIHNRVIQDLCRQRNFPSPVYVKINPESILPNSKSLFEPLRSQTQDDRCCTLEASVALCKSLGVDLTQCDDMLFNIKLLVDCLKSQTAAPIVYNVLTEERSNKIMKSHLQKPPGNKSGDIADEELELFKYVRAKQQESKEQSPKQDEQSTKKAKTHTSDDKDVVQI